MAIAAALGAPAAADAATISEGDGGQLVFRAADGEENSMSLQGGTEDVPGVTFYVGSTGNITSFPANCEDQRDWNYVLCPLPAGGVRLELGDGDDDYATSSGTELSKDLKITVDGGPGNDTINGWHQQETFIGGAGNDTLSSWLGDDNLDGGDGDDKLEGDGGSDRLSGGAGNDTLAPDGYEQMASDVVDGGDGIDLIESDYSSRFVDVDPPVAMTLGGGADDGRPGENDDVQGVERLVLSVGGKVTGSDAAEYVKLHQVGDDGELVGNGGDDELRAGDGADRVDGGAGNDKLDGGFGDDTITGGPGRDAISADLAGGDCGPLWCKYPYGNDVVEARDGEVDSITCGAGADKVMADASDTVAPDCEEVTRANDVKPDVVVGPGGGGAKGVTLGSRAKLRTALRKGFTVRLSGLAPGAVKVRALAGGKLVGRGATTAGADGSATAKVRFTPKARRSLARKRSVRLTIVAGAVRGTVALKR